MKHLRIIASVIGVTILLALTACGGGDGGGGTPRTKAWGTAQKIETDAGDAGSPQIAVDAGGNAIAVWHQSDGARDNIWANRFE